jgi:hypothetical protein
LPLWRDNHVAVKQLVDDFAQYLYLPRLAGPDVLTQAMRDGVALLTWRADSFAYAESYDRAGSRYRRLKAGQNVIIGTDDPGLLVRPDLAARQLDAETKKQEEGKLDDGDRAAERRQGRFSVALIPCRRRATLTTASLLAKETHSPPPTQGAPVVS